MDCCTSDRRHILLLSLPFHFVLHLAARGLEAAGIGQPSAPSSAQSRAVTPVFMHAEDMPFVASGVRREFELEDLQQSPVPTASPRATPVSPLLQQRLKHLPHLVALVTVVSAVFIVLCFTRIRMQRRPAAARERRLAGGGHQQPNKNCLRKSFGDVVSEDDADAEGGTGQEGVPSASGREADGSSSEGEEGFVSVSTDDVTGDRSSSGPGGGTVKWNPDIDPEHVDILKLVEDSETDGGSEGGGGPPPPDGGSSGPGGGTVKWNPDIDPEHVDILKLVEDSETDGGSEGGGGPPPPDEEKKKEGEDKEEKKEQKEEKGAKKELEKKRRRRKKKKGGGASGMEKLTPRRKDDAQGMQGPSQTEGAAAPQPSEDSEGESEISTWKFVPGEGYAQFLQFAWDTDTDEGGDGGGHQEFAGEEEADFKEGGEGGAPETAGSTASTVTGDAAEREAVRGPPEAQGAGVGRRPGTFPGSVGEPRQRSYYHLFFRGEGKTKDAGAATGGRKSSGASGKDPTAAICPGDAM
ncbi:hypothetical protein Efla_002526 [Eimeria flavescens]